MNHSFIVRYIHEYSDRGASSRHVDYHIILAEELTEHRVFEDVFGYPLEVISNTEDELTFRYRKKEFTLNKFWQILGTVWFSCPNEQVTEQYRCTFLFVNQYPSTNWDHERMQQCLVQMRENTHQGQLWKNIALGRELMCIMKDMSPQSDPHINPTIRKFICEQVIKEDMIDKRDALRLYMTFNEYWRINSYEENTEEAKNIEHDRKFHHTVDSNIYTYSWLLFEPDNKYSQEVWNEMSRLKTDPIQLTPVWEKNIYAVEKECERRLNNEPRGMGFCHAYWSTKRAVLAERGIQWRSPSSMNPRVMFD